MKLIEILNLTRMRMALLNCKQLQNVIFFIVLVIFVHNVFDYDYTSLYHQICDDAYISLKYAYNLWHFGELNYYPGYKVEGYTNFLWTLLMSLAYPLNRDPIGFVKALNLISGACLLLFIYLLTRELFNRYIATFTLIGFGLNLQVAYMSSWGLETVFYMMLYVASLYFYLKNQLINSSLFLAFAAMTRLEIIPFAATLLVLELFINRDKRRFVKLALPLALLFTPYFISRWFYYGHLLPNTFYAKTGSGIAIIKRGVEYLVYNLNKLNILYLLCLALSVFIIHLIVRKKIIILGEYNATKARLVAIAAIIVSCIFYSVYIIKVGGDVFNERLVVQYLPFYVFTILILTNVRFRYCPTVNSILSPIITAGLIYTGPTFPHSTHLTGWVLLGKYINSIAAPGDTLATDAAGALAYYSKLPTYDILGLNDVHIAHKQVKSIGTGVPGHEKQDNQYILNKKPTFITTWIDPDGGAGRGFKEYLDFLENYELIALLDTSSNTQDISRIKLIDQGTPYSKILQIRNSQDNGIYDWALYKRKGYPSKTIKLNIYQFKVDWKDNPYISIDEEGEYITVNKNINKEGYLFYGPYLRIDRGSYKISLDVSLKNASSNVIGNFDIFDGDKVLAEKKIEISDTTRDSQKIELQFSIDKFDEQRPVEFRFYYFKNADIKISNVMLERLG